MRAQLEFLLAGTGASLEVLDVDTDPALEARWGDKVPVLLAGTHELCCHRLDRPALARWLRKSTTEVAPER
jgi:hypothetical protein